MPRSSWKPPYVEAALKAHAPRNRLLRREPVQTWSRDTYIVPELIGEVIEVHNGNRFVRLKVTEDMIGHKLGEFSPTRKPCVHKRRR